MFEDRNLTFKFWALMDYMYLAGIACSFLWWAVFGVKLSEEFYNKWFMLWAGISRGSTEVVLGEVIIPLLLIGSMVVSARMLLKEDPGALRLVIWQSPFRVYYLMPSLAFIPDSSELSFGAKLLLWFVFSFLELVKFCTLTEWENSQPSAGK